VFPLPSYLTLFAHGGFDPDINIAGPRTVHLERRGDPSTGSFPPDCGCVPLAAIAAVAIELPRFQKSGAAIVAAARPVYYRPFQRPGGGISNGTTTRKPVYAH
jgi:hypothetical protein